VKLRPFRPVLVVVGAAAIIALAALAIRSQPGRDATENLELIRGECNRESIIPRRYLANARKIRNQLESGSIDRWRDITFRSGEHNEGIYLPHPKPDLNEAGVRINVVEVYVRGSKSLDMTIPVAPAPRPLISINLPEKIYLSCLDLLNNDFVDYF
jgi:hypothetical protein